MRVAPGFTNFDRWPMVNSSALGVTVPSLCTVSSAVQVSQPPLCGPPSASRTRFQSATDLAQLRVVPTVIVRACQVSVERKNWAGVSAAPCEPEHSVNQMPLSGWASCRAVCALGSPE